MVRPLTAEDVLAAYRDLKANIQQTPLVKDRYLSEKYQANIYLKREDLQIIRSFKIRGAYYAIDQLDASQLEGGVVCASAGNHAQGVAYTCQLKQVPAVIFMPTTTPKQKVDQVEYFGGDFVRVVLTEDTFDACNAAAHLYAQEEDRPFIEPYDDLNVILGQGTIGVEIHQQMVAQGEQPDFILAQIGGGGLISGIGAYVHDALPNTCLVGVEPTGAASMIRAVEAGQPVTLDKVDKFCDGTAVARAGTLTFEYAREYVDRFIQVPEGRVSQSILQLYTKQAIVAEPSGALTVAALEQLGDTIKGKNVVCLISGGNNDISRMAEIEEKALIYEGLQQYFIIKFPQRAGALREFVTDILNEDDDVTRFEYTKRINRTQAPVFIGVRLGKRENLPQLLERISEFDPNYINVINNETLFQLLV
ncbi:threonine ammonia-lyase IlvA [Hutsoniella sourekii]